MVLLCGTKGGLDTYDGVRLNHVVGGQQAITMVGEKVSPFIPGFGGGKMPPSKEAQIWVKALKGEGKLFVTAEQAFCVTRILDGIYESNRTGKPVFFD
jgi:predicted dehydrogenase